MTDFFRVGDKVRRIKTSNGEQGACIGTIATVTEVGGDGFIGVYYPGCWDDRGGSETWCACYAELFQELQHENEKDKEEPVKNTTTLQDAYIAMQEASGIKVGDTVRVLRKAADFEMGWNNWWADGKMDGYIGMERQVTDVLGVSGVVLEDTWRFPFFVLEKTKDAPRFIEINGHKVPEPEREALKDGEEYWTPGIHSKQGCVYFVWTSCATDNRALSNGLVHKTREAAEIHAKALLSFTSKGG